jgi:glutamate N-acetyltransferase / amino-acid N-acetyltransferase
MSAHPLSPLAPTKPRPFLPLKGVSIGTAAMGLRYVGRDDLLVLTFDEPAVVAGVLTLSSTASAPVAWCRQHLAQKIAARALVVIAGNSLAFTGKAGMDTTQAIAEETARLLGCTPPEIYFAATGVIGVPLAAEKVIPFLPSAVNTASPHHGAAAAAAICTTDTYAKTSHAQGNGVTISGIAKGSGMIQPNMATMLSFLVTDAALPLADLQTLLQQTADRTFNAITVDSDTSTSDTLLVFSTGKTPTTLQTFTPLLESVCQDLALQVVCDGEGAEKLITINVHGAINDHAARTVGLSIANSPLVKTAIAGEDANWGRVVAAVGKSGVYIEQERLSVSFGGICIAAQGGQVEGYDEAPVAAHLKTRSIVIDVGLNLGEGEATVWTCDLTRRYLDINAGYRS